MYNSHFGFKEKPFNITPDPKFFYANPVYQEAYANLLYGIQERKGFIVLTGEVGTGKTTLLTRLMNNLEESVRFVFFYNTTLTFEELLSFICDELGLSDKNSGRLQKIQALNKFLIAQAKTGGTTALLIDEAQNLTEDVLENLRLLSNLETASEKLLQIVLVGQSELIGKLSQPQLRQIKQRVALQCRLDSLKAREVGPFIHHRLRVVGYEHPDLFTPDAVQQISFFSQGIPRLINVICDNALLIAYATSAKEVSADMVKEVAHDLRLEPEVRAANVETATTRATRAALQNGGEKRVEGREAVRLRPRRTPLIAVAGVSMMAFLGAGAVKYKDSLETWLANLISSTAGWVKVLPRWGQGSSVEPESKSRPLNIEGAPVLAGHAKPVPSPDLSTRDGPGRKEISSAGGPSRQTEVKQRVAGEKKERAVVVQRGNTITGIARDFYGANQILAMDLFKEFNPDVADLNWVLEGQKLVLPLLTKETLLRKQSDGSYHFILGSFVDSAGAEKFAASVRSNGYEVVITPRRVSGGLLLHRVEIGRLKDLKAAYQAWDTATANEWLSPDDHRSQAKDR